MFSLASIQAKVNVFARLAARKQCPVSEFVQALALRAEKYGQVFFRVLISLFSFQNYEVTGEMHMTFSLFNFQKAPMKPDGNLENISEGTFFLDSINDKFHR